MVHSDTDLPVEAAPPTKAIEHVTISELRRRTSPVLDRAAEEGLIFLTRYGRVVAQVLPPNPADE